MSNTIELSIGELIDRLSVVNIKIFHLVDFIATEEDDEKVGRAARQNQALNLQRSNLINEINERLGHSDMIIKV